MPRKIPPVLGLALQNLLAATGKTSQDLADASGFSPNTISSYVTGGVPLTRRQLDDLAAKLGIGPARVERCVAAARLVLDEPHAAASPVDPVGEEWQILDQAVAFGLGEMGHLVHARVLRQFREKHYLADRKDAEARLQTLKGCSRAERRTLVEDAPEFHTWAVCVRLCDESIKLAPHSVRAALSWAALACRVARHVPDAGGLQPRLVGFAQPHLANALRVQGSLLRAEKIFVGARKHWEEGSDDAGLLDEGRVLNFEASLRRAQRRFPEALDLTRQSLELAYPDQVGITLLTRAYTFDVQGAPEAALACLEAAAGLIAGLGRPRLSFGLYFNWTKSLCKVGRAEEAAPLLSEIRALAEHLRNDHDLSRVLWLEATVLEGLGRPEEAVLALEQVQREFAARSMLFDYGLVSLDLALLYRTQGRWPRVSELAAEMVRNFRATGVHREQVAAAALLYDAAGRQDLTADFVAQLRSYFKAARTNPALRFAGCAA